MSAYLPAYLRFGIDGLDLTSARDQINISGYSRLTNLYRREGGAWSTRPGLTSLATAGTLHHSIGRLNDPQGSTFTRIFGVDTSLYYGQSGALTLAETGFSGDPLTLLTNRPTLSGDAWMFVGDRTKMRKIRVDGLDLPIGLPAPAAAATSALAAESTVTIEDFESNAGWSNLSGTGGAPAAPTVIAGKSGNALRFATVVGAASGSFYNFWAKALTVDLSTFGAGVDASDDDLMHLWVQIDRPDRVQEIQVFLCCNAGFSAAETAPPGVSLVNTDAYVKTFAASDFTGLVEQTQSALTAINIDTQRDVIEDGLFSYDDLRSGAIGDRVASIESARQAREKVNLGRGAWTEYGVAGMPLRRGDFYRIGGEFTRDWSDITGIVVLIKTSVPQIVNVALDHMFLRGGYGPDASEPGVNNYDVRVTNYDPRTGAESNGSPEQAEANFLAPLRQRITVTPAAAFGDAAVRQRVYVRGGVATADWFFVGVNTSDGGAFTVDQTDEELIASDTLETDHYQPVPTVNELGVTVLAQPLPAIWGPVQGMIFGCGDPYRPGHVYNCLPDAPDHWAADGNTEVCSPSEECMNGFVLGGQSFVFSRQALYALPVNLASAGTVTATPTGCKRGLVSRWGFTVGFGGVFFVSQDGIYFTSGGAEQTITDDRLWALFHGETRNGYAPVDFTQPTMMRLTIYRNELYFTYRDTGGVQRTLVRGLEPGMTFWRFYSWGQQVVGMFTEELATGAQTLLLGSRSTGKTYTHTGLTDDGTAIAWNLRTGDQDQGMPKQDKFYGGDLALDCDRGDATITATVYLENESSALTPKTISSGSERTRYLLDVFTTPAQARNVAFDLSGSNSTEPTLLYWLGYNYIPEPQGHVRWETERIDHGIRGWHSPISAFITLESTADVTLIVVGYNQSGTASSTKTYTISAGSGKTKHFVPFEATKGVLYKYVFTSDEEFSIHWSESSVRVQPWEADQPAITYVLGTEVGAMQGERPDLAAQRPGGA